MKRIMKLMALGVILHTISCDVATNTTSQSAEDSITSDSISHISDSTAKAASDSVTSAGKDADSSLRSIGDSIRADLNNAADKIKDRSLALSNRAKENSARRH